MTSLAAGIRVSDANTVLYLNDSTITNNIALGGDGGGCYVQTTSRIVIHNTVFSYNEARPSSTAYAGGLYVVNAGTVAELYYVVFIGNKGYSAAVTVNNYGQMTAEYVNMTDNDGGGGGVLAVLSNANVTVSRLKSTYNKCQYGCGVYIGLNGSAAFDTSEFSNNVASGSGGVVYLSDYASLEMNNVLCNNNNASESGSVAYLSNNSTFKLYDSDLFNNSCGSSGMFYAGSGTSTLIERCNMTYNTAEQAAVVDVTDGALLDIMSSFIRYNAATSNHVMRITGLLSKMTIFDCEISDNDGGRGSIIAAMSSGSIELSFSEIFDNYHIGVNNTGGTVIVDGDTVICRNKFHQTVGVIGGNVISICGTCTRISCTPSLNDSEVMGGMSCLIEGESMTYDVGDDALSSLNMGSVTVALPVSTSASSFLIKIPYRDEYYTGPFTVKSLGGRTSMSFNDYHFPVCHAPANSDDDVDAMPAYVLPSIIGAITVMFGLLLGFGLKFGQKLLMRGSLKAIRVKPVEPDVVVSPPRIEQ